MLKITHIAQDGLVIHKTAQYRYLQVKTIDFVPPLSVCARGGATHSVCPLSTRSKPQLSRGTVENAL
jgi:hypothetical protein